MKISETRGIIIEMINAYGKKMTVNKIVSFFKKSHKGVDSQVVKKEAEELVVEFKNNF